MSTQKERWAAKAERRDAWAARAEAQADRLEAGLNRDPAFLSQPGRIPGRAAEIRRQEKAHELRSVAATHREKAKSLVTMASRNAGDAEAAREVVREAISEQVAAGSFVSSIYGVRRVLKVNGKTLRIEGAFGPITIDKSLCKLVRHEPHAA